MIGMGTVINSALVLLGGLLGFLFGKALKDSYQDIMVKACGLSTLFIGASGTFKQMLTVSGGALGTTGEMMLVISMCLGGLLGEILDIEGNLERFGQWLKVKSHSEGDSRFIDGFTSASFTHVVFESGLRGVLVPDHVDSRAGHRQHTLHRLPRHVEQPVRLGPAGLVAHPSAVLKPHPLQRSADTVDRRLDVLDQHQLFFEPRPLGRVNFHHFRH